MKYTVTPAKLAIIKNATIIMAAIFGVLLLWIDEVLAEDTSEDDIECTDGVESFLLLELLILNYFNLFIFHMIPKNKKKVKCKNSWSMLNCHGFSPNNKANAGWRLRVTRWVHVCGMGWFMIEWNPTSYYELMKYS